MHPWFWWLLCRSQRSPGWTGLNLALTRRLTAPAANSCWQGGVVQAAAASRDARSPTAPAPAAFPLPSLQLVLLCFLFFLCRGSRGTQRRPRVSGGGGPCGAASPVCLRVLPGHLCPRLWHIASRPVWRRQRPGPRLTVAPGGPACLQGQPAHAARAHRSPLFCLLCRRLPPARGQPRPEPAAAGGRGGARRGLLRRG